MDPRIHELKKLLRLRMNGVTSTSMRQSGLNYALNYGLDAYALRDLAKRFEPDRELAQQLWSEKSRECKILATLLFPKAEFNAEMADAWLKDCFLPELTEQLCFNLLQHLEFAPEKALEWIADPLPETRTAGYILLLRLILGKKKLPDLSPALTQAEEDSSNEDFRLQQASNRLLERVKRY